MDNEKIKSNITSPDHWIRLVFIILFAFILYVASFVVGVLVLVQFLFALITGNDNTKLRQLGDSLTQFIAQTLQFLTYNSDDKPFPFADWPTPAPVVEVVEPEADAAPAPAAEASAPEVEVIEPEVVDVASGDDDKPKSE
ncbi:DUF4389 domain-containing protein [Gilvimarinus polysaccharolyticus]|uniref:DUF4389 domain-containing protein n=1 Tax=Gilvimarinus polysaccharolyticus TaxID=863921 RepID=UPI0006737A04|nr:DUF4389 domain-containing protein [Gilvimarinus polysaccharolyticus]